jgi:hypothetical protein
VAFALGYLEEDESQRIKVGLDLYPILKTDFFEYNQIANKIQNFNVLTVPPKIRDFSSRLQTVQHNGLPEQKFLYKGGRNANLYVVVILTVGFGIIFGSKWLFSNFNTKNAQLVEVLALDKPKRDVSANEPEVGLANATPRSHEDETKLLQNTKDSVAAKVSSDSKATSKTVASTRGGLFRGTLAIKQRIKSVNSELQAQLIKLGAVKAGEVELGWMKSKNVAYYHYTIPEKSVRDAGEALGKFGDLKVKYENHPRQISINDRRFIIEVQGLSVQ